jgi:DNA invertase Pin-like site-specific DNA recombinase
MTTAKGQILGYKRVSTEDQNTARQLEGVELDEVFADAASGKDTNRPQLDALLKHARKGDVLICHSMDRLARNLDDLRRLVNSLTKRGVQIRFVKEGLVFSGDDSPLSTLLLNVMGSFAEFERSLIRERQREGIAIAKRNGVYRGRKRSLSTEQVGELVQRVNKGERKASVARHFGVSRETIYSYLRLAERPKAA